MNIQDLGSIGELIAAVATVLTLIYLATQIRQNTNQLKGDAIISINNIEHNLDNELRADRPLFSQVIRATTNWKSLNPKEQAAVHLFFHSHTRWCETCWTLWTRGALDKETYDTREKFIVAFLGHPEGGLVWWNNWKAIYDPRFVDRINKKLADSTNERSLVEFAPFYEQKYWEEDDAI